MVIVVAGEVVHAPDMAVGEREERSRRPDGLLERCEDELEQVAVDDELVGPGQLRLDALERGRRGEQRICAPEVEVRDDEPADRHVL